MKQRKQIPVLFIEKKECCGCSACSSICADIGAIKMIPDIEGFLFPVINPELCVRCGRCLKVCPLKRESQEGRRHQIFQIAEDRKG